MEPFKLLPILVVSNSMEITSHYPKFTLTSRDYVRGGQGKIIAYISKIKDYYNVYNVYTLHKL